MCEAYCEHCPHCQKEELKDKLASLKYRLQVKFGIIKSAEPTVFEKLYNQAFLDSVTESLRKFRHYHYRGKRLPNSKGKIITFKRYSSENDHTKTL